MKLTTQSRFGLRFMVNLGLDYGKGPIYLKEISEKEEISEKYLSQLALFFKVRWSYFLSKGVSVEDVC